MLVAARREHDPVRSEPEGMTGARGHGDDIPPILDIALAVAIRTGGQDSPRAGEPHSVVTACGHLDDVSPRQDDVDSAASRPNSQRASVDRARKRVEVARRDPDHIPPTDHVQLPRSIFPAARTVPAVVTPTECQSPQVTAVTPHHSLTAAWPSVLRPVATTVPS